MKYIAFTIFLLCSKLAVAQVSPGKGTLDAKPQPWSSKQLIQPADLASMLKTPGPKTPHIFNIGVVDNIKGAKLVGAANTELGRRQLKSALASLPRNSAVIIYCGCCPFDKCPNIRPSFAIMQQMGFVNGKLLNLPVNLKQNWIDKGYPMERK